MSTGKPIIGLAGGIGSGKSTVASILGESGAAVISADRLNHDELNSPEVLEQLRGWWGDRVVRPEGRADRDAIRRIVTRDERERRRLEELVHPRIARRRNVLTERFQADPQVRAIVWDIPLLFEAGYAEACDYVIFVESSRPVREARVLGPRGWTAEDYDRFEQAQMPLAAKQENADFEVANVGDLEGLRRQVQAVLSRILAGRDPRS